MLHAPECLSCGTCCFSRLDTFVSVSGDDHARLAERGEELVWFDGIHAYMRMSDGHCGALKVDALAGQLFCTAYANRPQICRDLARGSSACQGELAGKSQRPLLALRLAR